MASLQSRMEADLEEMVTCAICTFRMKDPKHLQCQHAFCAQCLEDWMASPSNTNSSTVPCPSCRHPTELPAKGIAGLPSDFNKNVLLEMLSPQEVVKSSSDSQICSICKLAHGYSEPALSFCSDCEEYLCGGCLGDHNSEPALKNHCVIVGLSDDLQATGHICDVHNGKKLAFYCPQCLKLICSVCLRTTHRGHGSQSVEEAAKDRKQSLQCVMDHIEESCRKLNTACQFTSRNDIDAMFDALQEEISQHAQHAKASVDKWHVQASKDLMKRKQVLYGKMEKRMEHQMLLVSLRNYYHEKLYDPDPRTLLTGFKELLSRAEPLTNIEERTYKVPKWSFVPLVWPNRLGYLEEEGVSGSRSRSIGFHNASVSKEGEGTSSKGLNRSLSDDPPGTVRLSLDKSKSSKEESGILEEIADMLDYRNKSVACSNPTGIVNGQMKMKATESWPGNETEDQIGSATDVILGSAEWILVADPSRGSVQRLWFDECHRTSDIVLQDATPRRMALSNDGSIAVTDQGYVHMLAVNAQTISKRPKWTPLGMVQPFAVAFVEQTHQIVLTDMHERNVVIYDENLRHTRSFGGPSVFASPNCICCDQNGRILISDQTKNTVQAFSLNGEFLWNIRHFKPHQPLVGPSAICIDDTGQIFIGCLDGRIGVFTPDGHFICYLEDQTETMTNVRGISCRRDGDHTLVAMCGATTNTGAVVRLWRTPRVISTDCFHGESYC